MHTSVRIGQKALNFNNMEDPTLYLVKQRAKESVSTLHSSASLTEDKEKKQHYLELIDKLNELIELV